MRSCHTRFRTLAPVAAALLATILASAAPAQTGCVGDCGRDDEVTVDEILAMVNIALGGGDVATCRAGDRDGDGQVTVDEIVAAVQNALDGCPVNPTRTWFESDLRIVQSACPPPITALLEEALAPDEACAITITVGDGSATAEDCEGGVTELAVDGDGIATTSDSFTADLTGSCELTIDIGFAVDLGRSPTTVDYDVNVATAGDCPVPQCEAILATTLTQR